MKQDMNPLRLFRVRTDEVPRSRTVGIMDLRRPPSVEGRVVRPAYCGEWLPAVVVWGDLARKTMRVPPVQHAAAVRIPAPCRAKPLQQMPTGRLTTRKFLVPKTLTTGDQRDHDCPYRNLLASHRTISPFAFSARFTQRTWLTRQAEAPVMVLVWDWERERAEPDSARHQRRSHGPDGHHAAELLSDDVTPTHRPGLDKR